MTLKLTFPDVCAKCGEPLAGGPAVAVVYAGDAWDGRVDGITGQPISKPLKEGMVLYTTKSFHQACAPEPGAPDEDDD